MDPNILWDIVREQIEERTKELRDINDISKLKHTFLVGSHLVFIQWKNNKEIFPSTVVILKDNHNGNIVIKNSSNQIEITPIEENAGE